MSDHYKIEEPFVLNKEYVFEFKGRIKEKIFVGVNEFGMCMFDHVYEKKRSFVDPNKVLNDFEKKI